MHAIGIALLSHPAALSYGLAAIAVFGAVIGNLGAFTPQVLAQVMTWTGPQATTDSTVGAHTLAQYVMTGAQMVYIFVTAAGAVNVTTRTAAQLYADISAQLGFNPAPGFAFELDLVNSGGGQITLVGGAGVTIVGTATVANGSSRTFVCVVTAANAITITNAASGTN